MAMKTLSSREVQKNFGSVADLVTSGEGVSVTRYGRPAFYILPKSTDTEAFVRRMASKRLSTMLKSAKPNPAAKALTQADVNQLISDCFA